jgi:hypothetical protein
VVIASEVGDVDVESLWCGEVRAERRQGSRLPFLQCRSASAKKTLGAVRQAPRWDPACM